MYMCSIRVHILKMFNYILRLEQTFQAVVEVLILKEWVNFLHKSTVKFTLIIITIIIINVYCVKEMGITAYRNIIKCTSQSRPNDALLNMFNWKCQCWICKRWQPKIHSLLIPMLCKYLCRNANESSNSKEFMLPRWKIEIGRFFRLIIFFLMPAIPQF